MSNESLGSKINKLREEGLSYKQIVKKLNCSLGSVSYHLGDGQKEKARLRGNNIRKKEHPYVNKIKHFTAPDLRAKGKNNISKACYKLCFQRKITDFCRIPLGDKMISKRDFTVQNVIDKFSENPKCALTGLPIDITKPSTYNFDHIIPRTRGGDNSIDNLQICTKQANNAKGTMTPDEFINLCKLVLENSNYTVIKN